jgi:hypothetical protein
MSMKLEDIRQRPTAIRLGLGAGSRWHESVLRAFHVVDKVKDLLAKNTPAEVILEIIEDLMGAPPTADHPGQ